MATVAIYRELCKATGDIIIPKEDEDKTEFLIRLTEGVSALDDDAFDKLSPAAQKWFNSAGEAINNKKPKEIPDLEVPELSKSTETSTETPAEESKVKVKTAKKVAVKKAAVKAVKGAAAKKSAAPAGNGAKKTRASHANGSSTNYIVKNAELAKRGFLKEFVETAVATKKFTRDELVNKVKGKKCDEARARSYFYWCTGHDIFAEAK